MKINLQNCEIVDIVEENGCSTFKLNIDNGTLVYSKKICDLSDYVKAVQNSITLVKNVPEYKNYVVELNNLLKVA